MKMELGWAFTRTPNPDKDTFEAAMDVFTKNGISIDNFRRVPHSPDCVHLFEDTCLKRDYPKNKFEDLLYFARYQTENLVRKFLNLFGLNQVEKRPVPDDTVNFYLDQTRKRENAWLHYKYRCSIHYSPSHKLKRTHYDIIIIISNFLVLFVPDAQYASIRLGNRTVRVSDLQCTQRNFPVEINFFCGFAGTCFL